MYLARAVAALFNVLYTHMVKVVHRLGQQGWITTTKGEDGGLRLSRSPASIRIGDVLRSSEPEYAVIDCFTQPCPLRGNCLLKHALDEGHGAFFSKMNEFTLADVAAIPIPKRLATLFGVAPHYKKFQESPKLGLGNRHGYWTGTSQTASILNWAKKALDTLILDATGLVPPIHTIVNNRKASRRSPESSRSNDLTAADWIVLGADGRHRFISLNTSAAYQVLAAAECPVLTLRHEPYRTESRNSEGIHFAPPL